MIHKASTASVLINRQVFERLNEAQAILLTHGVIRQTSCFKITSASFERKNPYSSHPQNRAIITRYRAHFLSSLSLSRRKGTGSGETFQLSRHLWSCKIIRERKRGRKSSFCHPFTLMENYFSKKIRNTNKTGYFFKSRGRIWEIGEEELVELLVEIDFWTINLRSTSRGCSYFRRDRIYSPRGQTFEPEGGKGQGSIRLPTDHCHFTRAIIKGNIILFRLFSSSTVPRSSVRYEETR